MGLTNTKTLFKIQTLFDYCFISNAKLDRIVYELDIKFNLPSFQNWIHQNIAHLFPVLADNIQEFGSLRGDLFYRGAINKQDKDYLSVSETMYDLAMCMAELEKLTSEAIKEAINNQDLMYEDFLRDFNFNKLAPLTKQAAVFFDAIKSYENANAIYKWNNDYGSYIISEFKGGN